MSLRIALIGLCLKTALLFIIFSHNAKGYTVTTLLLVLLPVGICEKPPGLMFSEFKLHNIIQIMFPNSCAAVCFAIVFGIELI